MSRATIGLHSPIQKEHALQHARSTWVCARHLVNGGGRDTHPRASVTKQYNLVPASGQ